MPGVRSNSPLGRAVGVAVAVLAVVLLALDRLTGLSVPYGYDGGGTSFLLGAAVAAVAVAVVGYRYFQGR